MKQPAFVLFSALVVSSAVAAGPALKANSVSLSQDPHSRNIIVDYELEGEPAIITVDFVRTATGQSIGAENFADVCGDVNRKVSPGKHVIKWHPSQDGEAFSPGELDAKVNVWATNAPPDYLVADLLTTNVVRFYASTNAFPGGFGSDRYKTRELVMRRIPAAGVKWRQGMPSTQPRVQGKCANRYVTLTADYYIGVYEFTAGQNSCIANAATGIPTTFSTLPKGDLSTDTLRGAVEADGSDYGKYNWPADAHNVKPVSTIGKIRGVTGLPFDLPTEAQWEYACRAGSQYITYFGTYDDSWNIGAGGNPYGWTQASGVSALQGVGLLLPNRWMLYDMHGNVWERCLDWYGDERTASDVADPEGPFANANNRRLLKGGGYNDTWTAAQCGANTFHAANGSYSTQGARLCCPICEW